MASLPCPLCGGAGHLARHDAATCPKCAAPSPCVRKGPRWFGPDVTLDEMLLPEGIGDDSVPVGRLYACPVHGLFGYPQSADGLPHGEALFDDPDTWVIGPDGRRSFTR